jgi:arsenate reductase (thioredoxin)
MMHHILFICTHNSARSILAEALLNHHGAGRFAAYSAGSAPRENQQPNPLGLLVLAENGLPTALLRSQSWDEFTHNDSPRIDLAITVCDSAAGEVCPLFLGAPTKAHWSYADPSAGTGSDDEKLAAFRATFAAIERRILAFIAACENARSAAQLQAAAQQVGGV